MELEKISFRRGNKNKGKELGGRGNGEGNGVCVCVCVCLDQVWRESRREGWENEWKLVAGTDAVVVKVGGEECTTKSCQRHGMGKAPGNLWG